jgi:hypothetical protein
VLEHVLEDILGDVAAHLRFAGLEHARAAMFRGQRLRIMILQLMQLPFLGRTVVSDRYLPQVAVLVRDIDDAEVREARNHEAREVLERLLILERSSEDVARVSEEGEAFLARFRFAPRACARMNSVRSSAWRLICSVFLKRSTKTMIFARRISGRRA